jgi:predicted nucleic acid-binding protein
LYVSRPIQEEYSEVLARELRIRKGLRQQLLQLIRNRCYTVAPTRRLEVTSDADDNIFVECADAARADYLVTGNQKHFPGFWKKTKVITAREDTYRPDAFVCAGLTRCSVRFLSQMICTWRR